MDPQHTGDLLKHLEKQNEILKESHKTMSQELQKLMVEEEMMMHKLCELMVTHRKYKKELKKTQNLLEGKVQTTHSVLKYKQLTRSLMPTITSEIFGIRHMGTIYFTISIAGPIGSYLLSVKVIGYFYDKVASEDDNSCFGSQCFGTSFMIMASVALFGSLVACILFFRTNKFYKKLVAKRSLK